MRFRRRGVLLAVSILAAVVLGAALLVGLRGGGPMLEHGVAAPTSAPTSTAPTASPSAAPSPHAVLALGDSVPSGHACDCRPFPQTYGALLGRQTGARVTVDNQAVSGLTTAGLISQLREPAVEAAVRRADIVLVTIGANDFGDHHDQVEQGRCETGNSDCVADEMGTLRDHMDTVLSTIRTLRQGHPTTILVTGYWNVFEDGDVARHAYGTSGLAASLQLTRRANAVISSASDAAGARYVDLFQPFEHSGRDITSLLAADGDHPDAAGHVLIARALLAAGLPQLR